MVTLPPIPPELQDDEVLKQLQPGSLLHQVYIQAQMKKPIDKTAKRITTGSTQRKRILAVRIPQGAAPASKLQERSMRAKIMRFIQDQPEQTATVEILELNFECPVRGHLQKLLEKNHLESIE